jgi:hypothetical protein
VTIALDRPGAAWATPRLAFACGALLLTGALAVVVYAAPMNCNDFLQHLFTFESHSFYRTFELQFIKERRGSSDWRPLQYTTSHALYLAARGHEHLVFKGLLSASVVMTAWLLARLTPARTWGEAAAAMTALMILFGHQSFAGAVEGVYPYGVEIILVICELVVLGVLVLGRPTLWSAIAVTALSLFAILLNEKGALVGVTYIVGAAVRMPGASYRAGAAVFLVYVAVLALRLGYYTGIVGMASRGTAPSTSGIVFDVVAPALNVLISDPRFGKFRTFVQAFVWLHPWAIITVLTSVTTLVLILAWAVRTFDLRNVSTELKAFAILPFMLVGSMLFGAFSQKDYIPIMALPVYALASFYAMRWALARAVAPVALAIGIVMFAGWAVRTVGLFYYLQRMAHSSAMEWAIDAERVGHFNKFDPAMARPILERLRAHQTSWTFRHPDELIPEWLVLFVRGRDCPEFCGKLDFPPT